MFAEACRKAAEFTRPVVVSTRHQNGEVKTECGSFIVLNREGWVLTAGHMYDSFVKYQSDSNKLKEIQALNESRLSRPGSPSSEVKPDPSYIVKHSFWWGWDGVKLNNVFVNRQVDIAVGRLEPFDPSWIKTYPVLRDPDGVIPGTSVCRTGYPFLNISSTYDEKLEAFKIPKIPIRESVFPNDGMVTRIVSRGMTNDNKFERLYVETSTPGLRGQSGGPVFDTEGRLCAMQVQTVHMPLGFHPTVEYDGKSVVENQFLNVGLGVHVRTIRAVLDDRGVRYDCEGDETGFRIID